MFILVRDYQNICRDCYSTCKSGYCSEGNNYANCT